MFFHEIFYYTVQLFVVASHLLLITPRFTEQHASDSILEKAVSATERRLPFVPFLDPDEVVAVLVVDFVEVFCSSNSFLELIHIRKGKTVWDGDFFDCSIVNA